jgi:hypothetical protein
MAEQPQPSREPSRALSQPELSGTRRPLGLNLRLWFEPVFLGAMGALLGFHGSEGQGNTGFQTWQAAVVLGAALLAGAAVASKDWRQGVRKAVLILLCGGGIKLAVWAIGGWAGGLMAAVVGGVIGAAFGAVLALLPARPWSIRPRT